MPILYKYCDQIGIERILETLELKLPYIFKVNDPLECLPIFYFRKRLAKKDFLSVFRKRGIILSKDAKKRLNLKLEDRDYQKHLINRARETQSRWNQQSCLICVSNNAKNTVMWSHYADTHKGAVIGIDFDTIFDSVTIFPDIVMDPVKYSKKRIKIAIGEHRKDEFVRVLLTKSINWLYEQEMRTVFFHNDLEGLRNRGDAFLRNFRGEETWFLRINPVSIKRIIFGLDMEENLKLRIKNLINTLKLCHIRLYQATESELYDFDLVEVR